MTTTDRQTKRRYKQTEFDVGSETVTMILDQSNENAWIYSTVTQRVRR